MWWEYLPQNSPLVHIWPFSMFNPKKVGKHSIHGAYGIGKNHHNFIPTQDGTISPYRESGFSQGKFARRWCLCQVKLKDTGNHINQRSDCATASFCSIHASWFFKMVALVDICSINGWVIEIKQALCHSILKVSRKKMRQTLTYNIAPPRQKKIVFPEGTDFCWKTSFSGESLLGFRDA